MMESVNFDKTTFDPNENQKYQKPAEQQPLSYPYKRNVKDIRNSVKTIYTDGGSRILNTTEGKRYIGAWSFFDDDTKEIFGKAEDNSTNNQMELMACIKALEYLNNNGTSKEKQITIATDSKYVYFGMGFRCKKWIANNWMRTDQEGNQVPVKNVDLWKQLYQLGTERNIYWYKVPAHSGVEGNERADINCGMLMDEFIKNAGIVRIERL